MRLPRDLDYNQLVVLISRFGYFKTRQTGSHVRLTRKSVDREHHITIPVHNPLRIGTLSKIIGDVATHLGISRDDVLAKL